MKPSLTTGSGWLQSYIYCTYVVFILCVCSLFSSPGHLSQSTHPYYPTSDASSRLCSIWAFFTPFMTLIPPSPWTPGSLLFVTQVSDFWVQSLALAFLSSTGSFHLPPTSKCLSGLLDLCLPVLFLTLRIPFVFGVLHCPGEIILVWFSSLDDQGIRKYSYWELVSTGTSTLHWILCSLRFSMCRIHYFIPSCQHHVKHTRFSINKCSLRKFLRQ